MKIVGEVVACETDGALVGAILTLRIAARESGAGEWYHAEPQTLRVRDTVKNRRAFHVGRRVEITVRPL